MKWEYKYCHMLKYKTGKTNTKHANINIKHANQTRALSLFDFLFLSAEGCFLLAGHPPPLRTHKCSKAEDQGGSSPCHPPNHNSAHKHLYGGLGQQDTDRPMLHFQRTGAYSAVICWFSLTRGAQSRTRPTGDQGSQIPHAWRCSSTQPLGVSLLYAQLTAQKQRARTVSIAILFA